jgi:8-oxo-dGTP pyrophosphatase MutT (NUDIX family)
MKNRAGIVLIEQNKLALIERHRQERHYFSFPGGGIDEGETPEQTAVREAKEELGLEVTLKQKIAEVIFHGYHQHYFLAERIDGKFGSGVGEEYGEYDPVHGTFHPLWMSLEEILIKNVLPSALAELVARGAKDGWSAEFAIIVEDDN